jgi:hypothetical protein
MIMLSFSMAASDLILSRSRLLSSATSAALMRVILTGWGPANYCAWVARDDRYGCVTLDLSLAVPGDCGRHDAG